MFKKMKHMKNEKGLTLIELLAVIVILAIIAAIAIPAIGNIINNSRDKAVLSDAANMLAGAKIAIVDGACGQANASTNLITCDDTVLKDVFEGTVHDDDQITYNTSTKVYTITFNELTKIKNISKFTVAASGTSGQPGYDAGFTPSSTNKIITEISLEKAMNK